MGFHVDAYTGDVSGEKDELSGLPLGKHLFSGMPKTAFLLPFENCGTKNRVLAVVDQHVTVRTAASLNLIFCTLTRAAAHLSLL